jgi:tetratricopeptide (TPR) repeat protein
MREMGGNGKSRQPLAIACPHFNETKVLDLRRGRKGSVLPFRLQANSSVSLFVMNSRQTLCLFLLFTALAKMGPGLPSAEAKEAAEAKKEWTTGLDPGLLHALREFPVAVGRSTPMDREMDQSGATARAFEWLEGVVKRPPGTLAKELPAFATQLLQRDDISAVARARALLVLKKYAESETSALAAKDKALRAKPPDIVPAVAALMTAAAAASEQRHYQDSLTHYRNAAALIDKDLHPAEWLWGQSWVAIGLNNHGDSREAVDLIRSLIPLRMQISSEDDPETLSLRLTLVVAFTGMNRHAEAETELRKVLAVHNRVRGPEHSETLDTRSRLALALDAQHLYKDSEAEYRTVMAIRERLLGSEHPLTLMTRSNVATALHFQGKFEAAVTEYRAVLAVQERTAGKEDAGTLLTRHHLALVLNTQGKGAEAEALHRMNIAVQERVLGPDHPYTLKSHHELTAALCTQRKFQDAFDLGQKVVAARTRNLGAEHPDTLTSRFNIVIVLFGLGKTEEGSVELEKVFKARHRTLGEDHPDTVKTKAFAEAFKLRLPEPVEKPVRGAEKTD